MSYSGFGFIAVIAVGAYFYAVVTAVVASGAYFGLLRFTSLSRRTAARVVAAGVGALRAAVVGYGWFALGTGPAVFVGVTVAVVTLVTNVIPLGVGYLVLSRVVNSDAPLTHTVVGWSPSLVAPLAVAYLFGLPSPPAAWAVLAVPLVGPTVIGYAVHRVRSR